jgi:hypothetical protein
VHVASFDPEPVYAWCTCVRLAFDKLLKSPSDPSTNPVQSFDHAFRVSSLLRTM